MPPMSSDADKPEKDTDEAEARADEADQDVDEPEKATDKSEKKAADRRRRFKAGKGGAVEVSPERGPNRIPKYLTQELGLPDWLAGSLVIVVGGLLLTLLVWLLIPPVLTVRLLLE